MAKTRKALHAVARKNAKCSSLIRRLAVNRQKVCVFAAAVKTDDDVGR